MQLTMRDWMALGASALAVVALCCGAWLGVTSIPAVPRDAGASAGASQLAFASDGTQLGDSSTPSSGSPLVVDVQGAVAKPGVVVLPAGARVADAVAAAGGYSRIADLLAAAGSLNLAKPLADGEKVFVPIEGLAAAPTSAAATGGGPGLVNLNTASPEELDALPGIGPVTVQKIVAARAETPFTTLDELVEREVMNRGQLEDIRELVTF